MNILYLHQYFETNSGGTRSYEFSKYLSSRGHNVTMITGTHSDDNVVDGITIKSTNTSYHQTFSFIKRIYAFLHFMIKSTVIGLRQKDPDVIYATSTPLTIGISALIISKLKRKDYVFEVRDVWPDVPIQLGFIKSPLLQKVLFSLEKFIYKHASHIIVLSEGMKNNLIRKGIPESKLTVITNLSMNIYYDDLDFESREWEKDKLVCIHPGTMGHVNGLDFILDLAKEFYDEEILYLLIGEGNQKERLLNRIIEEDIRNVIIEDALPKNQVIKKIKQSDVGIMTVDDYKILEDNSANKFFDFLAAGLPVVLNYEGWQKNVLEKHNAGRGFQYGNKQGFYNFLVQLKNDSEKRSIIGSNAKKLALKNYDSLLLARKMEKVLKDITKKEL